MADAALFPALPRRPRRKLMHVVDAGTHGRDQVVQFSCARCGFRSEWMTVPTITEAKRGRPWPTCEGSNG